MVVFIKNFRSTAWIYSSASGGKIPEWGIILLLHLTWRLTQQMSSGHRILISGMLNMQNITTLPEKTCGSEFLQMERYTSVRGAHRVFVHYLSEHVFFVKGYTYTLSKLVLNFFGRQLLSCRRKKAKSVLKPSGLHYVAANSCYHRMKRLGLFFFQWIVC